MAFVSSPVAYPPTSSPQQPSPHKRRKVQEERNPLQTLPLNTAPKTVGGFLLDESDDEDDLRALRRNLGKHNNGAQEPHTLPHAARIESESTRGNLEPEPLTATPVITHEAFEAVDSSESLGYMNLSSKPALSAHTCSGKVIRVPPKLNRTNKSYERIVAERSSFAPGRAQKAYYGIDIHALVDNATKILAQQPHPSEQTAIASDPQTSIEQPMNPHQEASRPAKTLLWTEKYRAKKFTDLVGDERTHRSVLRWLKSWDKIVFPGTTRLKAKLRKDAAESEPERAHRKLLLLTGPPGLGKTTLAHVCAKQAGYEVQEINASDERSRDVVKGRIRDMVGTENVRPVEISAKGSAKKASRPVCVIVDEVDGVVGGSGGGGEGGFIKALIDLINLDQKNSNALNTRADNADSRKKRKGDNFRMLRPIILICNDVYHPSLRPLRQGMTTEIIHVRKPPLNMVVPRMLSIFEKEGVPCDSDGVRQLCEAAWGVTNRKEDRFSHGTGDGDVRGILVVGEWVAAKLRTSSPEPTRLTRRWVEQHVLSDLAYGGGAARSIGRGGSREIVEKVFAFNAGFTTTTSFAAPQHETSSTQVLSDTSKSTKSQTMERLNQLIQSSGEDERILSDCFATYATHPFQDDTFLSKPNIAYDWLHFHDALSGAVHLTQEWELAQYLSQPILAFHHLFASNSRASQSQAATTTNEEETAESLPFSGPRASYAAHEAEKANRASLQSLHSLLSLPLRRTFRSTEATATELMPYTVRMLNPDIKPVVVGGGGSERSIASVRRAAERDLVSRAVECMIATGVKFEKSKVEVQEGMGGAAAAAGGGWVYRMDPPLDALGVFETADVQGDTVKVRYAVRQVLEQEWTKETKLREVQARMRRGGGRGMGDEEEDAQGGGRTTDIGDGQQHWKDNSRKTAAVPRVGIKRDFFGRPVVEDKLDCPVQDIVGANKRQRVTGGEAQESGRIWVTYHEGYSNAVRKGITLKELLEGM